MSLILEEFKSGWINNVLAVQCEHGFFIDNFWGNHSHLLMGFYSLYLVHQTLFNIAHHPFHSIPIRVLWWETHRQCSQQPKYYLWFIHVVEHELWCHVPFAPLNLSIPGLFQQKSKLKLTIFMISSSPTTRILHVFIS